MAKQQVDWIRLHNAFYEDDKIEDLSDSAFRAFLCALCLSDRLNTDGRLSKTKAASVAKPTIRKELVTAGLWLDAVDGSVELLKFLEWQRSAAEKEEARRKKSKAGRLGGLASGEARREANAEADASPPALAPAEAKPKQSKSEELEVEAVRGRRIFKGSGPELPGDKEYELGRLLTAIGSDADIGTKGVIRSLACDLPSFTLAKMRESLEIYTVNGNRAAYVVGALKKELEESKETGAA